MTDFRFEILSLKDLDKVIDAEKRSHQFPWSEKNFKDCIDNAYWNYVLVDISAERNILGHCIVLPGVEELHLLNITICPEYRRENIASRTLFAIEETPYLKLLIEREFNQQNDIENAVNIVMSSQGIDRSRALATHHASTAIKYLDCLSPSPSKQALFDLSDYIVSRLY